VWIRDPMKQKLIQALRLCGLELPWTQLDVVGSVQLGIWTTGPGNNVSV
jgi:hypothetical protein